MASVRDRYAADLKWRFMSPIVRTTEPVSGQRIFGLLARFFSAGTSTSTRPWALSCAIHLRGGTKYAVLKMCQWRGRFMSPESKSMEIRWR